MLEFHFPSVVHNKVSSPIREYPVKQLNLYKEPSIQPVPLTSPFCMDEGSFGHSNGMKNHNVSLRRRYLSCLGSLQFDDLG